MSFAIVEKRRALLFAAIAGFAALAAAPARAQAPQEDTNPVNSVLGFFGMQFDKEKEDINYRARPPLVVPPKLDLPAPKQVARAADWPKDPDSEERRHSAAAANRPAPQPGLNARVELSAEEMQKNRTDTVNAGPSSECQAGAGTPICLYTPWEVLQKVTGGGGKSDTVEAGVEPPRTYLTEPPLGYRKPTATASATKAIARDAPDDSDPKAYMRSQQRKSSVDPDL